MGQWKGGENALSMRVVSFQTEPNMFLSLRLNLTAVSGFHTKAPPIPISLDSN
jgi:hypothetical protein